MLLSIIVTLVIVGVVLYLINLIEMDPTIKKIIHVLIILFVILWILNELNVVHTPLLISR